MWGILGWLLIEELDPALAAVISPYGVVNQQVKQMIPFSYFIYIEEALISLNGILKSHVSTISLLDCSPENRIAAQEKSWYTLEQEGFARFCRSL